MNKQLNFCIKYLIRHQAVSSNKAFMIKRCQSTETSNNSSGYSHAYAAVKLSLPTNTYRNQIQESFVEKKIKAKGK